MYSVLVRKPFYFLRHGQTDWNVAKRIQGQTDIPLNNRGREQAQAASHVVSELSIDAIYTSQLSRAYETAQIVKPSAQMTLSTIAELKEVTIGERDGHQSGDWYQQWKAGELVIAGAETRVAFRQRVLVGMNAVLNEAHNPLIVSHGGVFGALKESLNITPDIAITNCMLLHLTPDLTDAEKWQVEVLFAIQ